MTGVRSGRRERGLPEGRSPRWSGWSTWSTAERPARCRPRRVPRAPREQPGRIGAGVALVGGEVTPGVVVTGVSGDDVGGTVGGVGTVVAGGLVAAGGVVAAGRLVGAGVDGGSCPAWSAPWRRRQPRTVAGPVWPPAWSSPWPSWPAARPWARWSPGQPARWWSASRLGRRPGPASPPHREWRHRRHETRGRRGRRNAERSRRRRGRRCSRFGRGRLRRHPEDGGRPEHDGQQAGCGDRGLRMPTDAGTRSLATREVTALFAHG